MKRAGSLQSSAALLLAAVTAVLAQLENPCCLAIQANLPAVYHDSTSPKYASIKASYWTAREGELSPNCFAQPTSAEEVSTIVQILNQPQFQNINACKFAIRSGGHLPWAGAANIQGGVTIDLSMLKQIEVKDNGKMVSLGPGNRWVEVYNKIEPLGLAVSGGRWGNVGVGGFMLGGGLSFFQGLEGLGCDGIINHQIVLSNGSIINANERENADLHKVLKGGNNNFGIVTRFDLKAYTMGSMWGGQVMGLPGRQNLPIKWFEDFASHKNKDPYGQTMLNLHYNMGTWSSSAFVTYAKADPNPAPFRSLTATQMMNTTKFTSYRNIALQNGMFSPNGMRTSMSTFTYVNSAAFMSRLLDLAQNFNSALPMFSGMTIIFQPLWAVPRANAFAATGGNILGLEGHSDDLVIVLVQSSWIGVENDAPVVEATEEFIEAANALAQTMGVYSPYIYANYAAEFQDPVAGYGDNSMALMRAASAKYDPTDLFQRRVPGGFKLGGPATRDIPRQPSGWGGLAGLGPGNPAEWELDDDERRRVAEK